MKKTIQSNYIFLSSFQKKYCLCPIILIILILSLLYPFKSLAETAEANPFILYNSGKYKPALSLILKTLRAKYEERSEGDRIPSDYIYISKKETEKDINDLFRNRKAKGFFIEESIELFKLHLFAARACHKLYDYNGALNHYFQALRFKPRNFDKDDSIAYEISLIYKKLNHLEAHSRLLEVAYHFNPDEYKYSLELARTLSKTSQKKKAIFHLRRYLQHSKDNDPPPDIKLYLLAGNLNEDLGRYLETVKYYKLYLQKKKNDGHVLFALGYLACKKTGDFNLAFDSFKKSLAILPETDIFRKSKAYEYMGDMHMKNLEFEKAKKQYLETIQFQDKINTRIYEKTEEIKNINKKIKKIKSSLRKKQDYNEFNEFQILKERKGRLQKEKKEMIYQFNKLNPGKARWNIAESCERLEELSTAINFYRKSISFNYKARAAREKIYKLQLKINRGY